MTFDQLSSLIKAGFTEQQIKTVLETFGNSNPAPSGSPTTDPTPDPVPTPNPEQSPSPAPVPSPAADQPRPAAETTPAPTPTPSASPAESETVALLREMLGLVRQNNINSIGNTPPAEKDGAQVLAEILNPQPNNK